MHRSRFQAPAGYLWRQPGNNVRLLVAADAADALEQAVAAAGSLYGLARQHQRRILEGRSRLYVMDAPGQGRWVVRHLTHGGALATLTGDCFPRLGFPRPFNELWLAEHLRGQGIATPRVVAATTHVHGLCYRGDIAREWLEQARDLASCLLGEPALDADVRAACLRAAGMLVRRVHDAGLFHPDLNLRNILIDWQDGAPEAMILDLEKCRLQPRLRQAQRQAMLARLARSLGKLSRNSAHRVTDREWAILTQAYERAGQA